MSLWDFPYGRIVPRPLAANMCSEKSAADWELDLETVLVKRNLDDATKGSHEPRPLVTPIYTSSTYLLESAKEGEMLSMNHAKVNHHSTGKRTPCATCATSADRHVQIVVQIREFGRVCMLHKGQKLSWFQICVCFRADHTFVQPHLL